MKPLHQVADIGTISNLPHQVNDKIDAEVDDVNSFPDLI